MAIRDKERWFAHIFHSLFLLAQLVKWVWGRLNGGEHWLEWMGSGQFAKWLQQQWILSKCKKPCKLSGEWFGLRLTFVCLVWISKQCFSSTYSTLPYTNIHKRPKSSTCLDKLSSFNRLSASQGTTPPSSPTQSSVKALPITFLCGEWYVDCVDSRVYCSLTLCVKLAANRAQFMQRRLRMHK